MEIDNTNVLSNAIVVTPSGGKTIDNLSVGDPVLVDNLTVNLQSNKNKKSNKSIKIIKEIQSKKISTDDLEGLYRHHKTNPNYQIYSLLFRGRYYKNGKK